MHKKIDYFVIVYFKERDCYLWIIFFFYLILSLDDLSQDPGNDSLFISLQQAIKQAN